MVEQVAKELIDYAKVNGFGKDILLPKAQELSAQYDIPINDILFSATAKMTYEFFMNKNKKGE